MKHLYYGLTAEFEVPSTRQVRKQDYNCRRLGFRLQMSCVKRYRRSSSKFRVQDTRQCGNKKKKYDSCDQHSESHSLELWIRGSCCYLELHFTTMLTPNFVTPEHEYSFACTRTRKGNGRAWRRTRPSLKPLLPHPVTDTHRSLLVDLVATGQRSRARSSIV